MATRWFTSRDQRCSPPPFPRADSHDPPARLDEANPRWSTSVHQSLAGALLLPLLSGPVVRGTSRRALGCSGNRAMTAPAPGLRRPSFAFPTPQPRTLSLLE